MLEGAGRKAPFTYGIRHLQPLETSAGFLLDSREFLVAAELVLNSGTGASLPVYFLLARSIELSLKAFLLEGGLTPKTLWKAFGHNLVKLHGEAVKLNLHHSVPLNPVEINVIDILSHEYLGTGLAYRVSGGKYLLPRIDLTEEVAKKLWGGVETFCASFGHSSQQLTER